ncbi:ThuA domain-containing protein [Sphingopyxis sp. PAMC25046]|uniref:ThuA domain-containing protein n=1 Tax=Sphingopyxis sp. PAMC25046 TaxID=2565556 RepID=UPI00109DCC63|nr:ThuA domain-containing protein [Sphingopyxis sp. PAMC25046]QCB56461.1 ThuA domain-containing protein [Sphingopyxis sp. PAMC25046]
MITAAKLAATLLLMLGAAQASPDPRRPAPTFDRVPPELPALARPAVLIVSKTNGYRHDSIAEAVPAIEALVKARGWNSFATENAAVFNPRDLAKFDVVVFANASGDIYTPDQRDAFRAWIARGGGFVGLHSAGDGSHPGWFMKLRGNGRFTGHPGGADQFQAADLAIADHSHPATRHLPARWRWTDEYYSWDAPPAADAHILASLDESTLRLDTKYRMGTGHALIWWRCEGRARIFYSALGHKAEAWADPVHLKVVDGAIGWAARGEGTGCD